MPKITNELFLSFLTLTVWAEGDISYIATGAVSVLIAAVA